MQQAPACLRAAGAWRFAQCPRPPEAPVSHRPSKTYARRRPRYRRGTIAQNLAFFAPPRPPKRYSDFTAARRTFTNPDFRIIVRSTRHNAMANLNIISFEASSRRKLIYNHKFASSKVRVRLFSEPGGLPRGLPEAPGLNGRPRCFPDLFTASGIDRPASHCFRVARVPGFRWPRKQHANHVDAGKV